MADRVIVSLSKKNSKYYKFYHIWSEQSEWNEEMLKIERKILPKYTDFIKINKVEKL